MIYLTNLLYRYNKTKLTNVEIQEQTASLWLWINKIYSYFNFVRIICLANKPIKANKFYSIPNITIEIKYIGSYLKMVPICYNRCKKFSENMKNVKIVKDILVKKKKPRKKLWKRVISNKHYNINKSSEYHSHRIQ